MNFILLSGTTSQAVDPNAANAMGIWSLLIFIVPIVVLYLVMILPQRKREKKIQAMRRALDIGDIVTTVGGINGRVVGIKDEDMLIIETGPDKTKLRIKRWAVQSCDTITD